MSEMVERLVRVINSVAAMPSDGMDRTEAMRFLARSILTALREPTEEMLNAAWEGEPIEEHRDTWRRMVDAALGKAES